MRISAVLLLLTTVVSVSATDGSSGSPSRLRGGADRQSRRLQRNRRHVYAHNQNEENDVQDEQLQERDDGNKRMERREYNQGSSSASEETEPSDADVETSDRLARREYNNNND